MDSLHTLADWQAPDGLGDAWAAYRAALVYGYFMWGITQRVERPILVTFVQRLGTAVQDHASFDLLGV